MSCLSDVDIIKSLTFDEIKIWNYLNLDVQVQPASFDLRLAPTLRRLVSGHYDLDYASHMNKSVCTEQYCMLGDSYPMKPGEFLLASTIEKVELPATIRGVIHNKSTPARMGLSVCNDSAFVDPGFSGQLTLELVNNGPLTIVLRPGAMICQLEFTRLTTPSVAPYGDDVRSSHYQHQTEATPAARHEK